MRGDVFRGEFCTPSVLLSDLEPVRCLDLSIDDESPRQLRLFVKLSPQLHAHLAGVVQPLRLRRNGQRLPQLQRDLEPVHHLSAEVPRQHRRDPPRELADLCL